MSKKVYTEEFKEQAVELAESMGNISTALFSQDHLK